MAPTSSWICLKEPLCVTWFSRSANEPAIAVPVRPSPQTKIRTGRALTSCSYTILFSKLCLRSNCFRIGTDLLQPGKHWWRTVGDRFNCDVQEAWLVETERFLERTLELSRRFDSAPP